MFYCWIFLGQWCSMLLAALAINSGFIGKVHFDMPVYQTVN